MSFRDYDDNAVGAYEADEARSARHSLSEMERTVSCGHVGMRSTHSGDCSECGDSADYDRPEE